ncbi:ATV_HP_G0159020.mRNA.1.CDS.1 [Saccharomyces cerevisiae]|nr:ATV_HP_G0159020.mRNA.1.CDS.1 [Saccharomyces cerevisiae]CAI6938356.1 ATV_HP_G0159020.mRNA.1.CDS.1 [Saccharomyces cerevisiae]
MTAIKKTFDRMSGNRKLPIALIVIKYPFLPYIFNQQENPFTLNCWPPYKIHPIIKNAPMVEIFFGSWGHQLEDFQVCKI